MCRANVFILGALVITAIQAGGDQTAKRRARRTVIPLAHDIYSLDNFIALVGKIERHPATEQDSLKTIANYVRKLAYDDSSYYGLWSYVLGSEKSLPRGVLNSEEERVLTAMVAHGYDGTREKGVIRTPRGDTIALGHVITGICAGLNRDTELSLAQWFADSPQTIDNLFVATISGDLGQTGLKKKNGDQAEYLGPGGTWFTEECPSRFNRAEVDEATEATDAEILGDIDGLVLGHGVQAWASRGARLSQLFKMYYGDGVLYDQTFRDCSRWAKFKELVRDKKLVDEVEGFARAFYARYSGEYGNVNANDLRGMAAEVVAAFYTYVDNLPEAIPDCKTTKEDTACEIPANVVFVMDESGSIGLPNYIKEKAFVKNITASFDISPLQARIAVVEYSHLAENPIGLYDYDSKTPLLCHIDSLDYRGGGTWSADAIALVHDEILAPEQNSPQDSNRDGHICQIVVFLTDGMSNDPDNTSLHRETSRIKAEIKGLTIIAVGVANYVLAQLEMIATDPKEHVFTVDDFDGLVDLVKSIRKKTCDASSPLDIDFRQTENETEVVAYVSPGKPRFYTIPSKYFFGAEILFIQVTPVYGTVTLYSSRVTTNPGPTNFSLMLEAQESGEPMDLQIGGPCNGYNSPEYCPPVYLGIYGKESELSCSDRDCSLPNQIKFFIKRGAPTPEFSQNRSEMPRTSWKTAVAWSFTLIWSTMLH